MLLQTHTQKSISMVYDPHPDTDQESLSPCLPLPESPHWISPAKGPGGWTTVSREEIQADTAVPAPPTQTFSISLQISSQHQLAPVRRVWPPPSFCPQGLHSQKAPSATSEGWPNLWWGCPGLKFKLQHVKLVWPWTSSPPSDPQVSRPWSELQHTQLQGPIKFKWEPTWEAPGIRCCSTNFIPFLSSSIYLQIHANWILQEQLEKSVG